MLAAVYLILLSLGLFAVGMTLIQNGEGVPVAEGAGLVVWLAGLATMIWSIIKAYPELLS